ncbi:MAG: hypothetical protein E3K37_12575 [Candidatus Kuenenia sp.]|nr:hypothetical protein [Candidatus Kuenenia hertensis]
MNKILQVFPSIIELKKLIMHTSATVWKYEITEKEIDRWLNNFNGEVLTADEEKVLALWLLSNFVYYNDDEVIHLCKVLMRDFIHKILIDANTIQDKIDNDLAEIIARTRFLALGEASESGGYILYHFRRINDLHISYFIFSKKGDTDSVDNLVYIDDVTLTAGKSGQAYRKLKKIKSDYPNKKIILLTLIASEVAITELKKIGVEVVTTIILDNRNKCFSPVSDIFHTYSRYRIICKNFVLHYGNKIDSNWPLGYEKGEYAFGFFYNTPDNTLPIFWGTGNGWYPIFKRYDKNYKRRELAINEKFL